MCLTCSNLKMSFRCASDILKPYPKTILKWCVIALWWGEVCRTTTTTPAVLLHDSQHNAWFGRCSPHWKWINIEITLVMDWISQNAYAWLRCETVPLHEGWPFFSPQTESNYFRRFHNYWSYRKTRIPHQAPIGKYPTRFPVTILFDRFRKPLVLVTKAIQHFPLVSWNLVMKKCL